MRIVTYLALFILLSPFLPPSGLLAQPPHRVIHVSGDGLVKGLPDQVVVSMTITAVDDDLIRVRANGDKQARTVLELAKKHGAGDKQFEVSRLDLSLDYNEQLRRQIYKIERDLSIVLDDLSKLDPLLSELLILTNTKVTGIEFGTSQARQHQQEARRLAMVDAKETAIQLAKLAGLELGKAVDVQVNSESQMLFATSVVPVVGEVNPFAAKRARDLVKDGRQPSRSLDGSATTPAKFVSWLQNDKDSADQAGGGKQPFALGHIVTSASVSVDYELVE